MTDHHLPDPDADDLDALASAHLDGATSAEEAARVAGDPALQARVEELRAVREAVAALPPVDTARREVAIAAALAAFAEDGAAASASPPLAPVTSLATVTARRRPSPTRVMRVVGAAAAVVLLAALVPLLGKLGGSDDDAASTAEDAGAVADTIDGGAPMAEGGAAMPTSTTAASVELALGRFDDLADLVAALEEPPHAVLDAPGTESAGDAGADARCAVDRETAASGSGQVTAATATVADEPVIVLLLTDADGARSVRVLDAATCSVLLAREL
jgi:hypothetical protein